MHYHHTTAHSKRDVARAMNDCTGAEGRGVRFILSVCLREWGHPPTLDPRAYRMICRSSPYIGPGAVLFHPVNSYLTGSCLPHEICIDRLTGPPDNTRVAYCVSTDNYRKIAKTLGRKEFGSIQIPADQPNAQQKLLVEAVLTGPTVDSSVRAQSMKVTALKKLAAINNVPQYGPLPRGAWACTDCWKIGPVAMPKGSEQISAAVTLAAGAAGVLYLTTSFSG